MTKEIKYQCVHQETGLCETCFKYETTVAAQSTRIEALEVALENIVETCHEEIKTRTGSWKSVPGIEAQEWYQLLIIPMNMARAALAATGEEGRSHEG